MDTMVHDDEPKICLNVPIKLFKKARFSCCKNIITGKNIFEVSVFLSFDNGEKEYLHLLNDTKRNCSWLFAVPKSYENMDRESMLKYGIGTVYCIPFVSKKRFEKMDTKIFDFVIDKCGLDELK